MTKKEHLLISAKKLFSSQGYDKTSIREIARDAQVNSSMISYYYGGKEGLLVGLFDYYFPEYEEDTKGYTTSLETLEATLRSVIKLREIDTELVDLLHSELLLRSPRLELIKPSIQRTWKRIYEQLKACQEAGIINVLSIDTAYLYLLAGISFPYHNETFHINSDMLTLDETFVDQLIQMLMKGLK